MKTCPTWTELNYEHGALVKQELRKSQNLGLHLVRACPVEMHMDISRRNFFMRRISNENASDQNRGAHLVRACAVKMHMVNGLV